MIRGGGWNNNAEHCQSSIRNRNTPDNRNNNLGFRPAAPLAQPGSATDGTGPPARTSTGWRNRKESPGVLDQYGGDSGGSDR